MSFEGLKDNVTEIANNYHEEFTIMQIKNAISGAARAGKYSVRVKADHIYIYSIDAKLREDGFKVARTYDEVNNSYKGEHVDISWQ